MKRRAHRVKVPSDARIGLAWYTRGAWERLCAITDDREQLDDSFEEWERGALRAIRELASLGRQVRKVPIDIDEYAKWCRDRGCRLDSASRAEYVTEWLSQEVRD